MSEIRHLINGYLKFRDGIPPTNEPERIFILNSTNELNNYFDENRLEKVKYNLNCMIDEIIQKTNRMNTDVGLSDIYLNQIYEDLYSSFSCTGFSIRDILMDNESNIKISLFVELLEHLIKNIQEKTNALGIVDEIEDEFLKKLQQKCLH